MRLTWLTSLLLVAVLVNPAAAAPVCEPATAGQTVAQMPEAWQQAVARLVRSTARPGHPWSCGGGTIELAMDATTATLTVVRRGDAPIARELTDPDDVVPLGQALLAMPREPVVVLPPAPTPLVEPAPIPPPAPVRTEPRVVLGAGPDSRFAQGAGAVLVGGSFSAGLPVGRWLPALHVRYGAAVVARGTGLVDLDVGAGLARVWPTSVFDLRVGLTAGAAVLLRDLPRPLDVQVRLDPRVGLHADIVRAVTPLWHVFGRVEAQWAPGRGPDRAAIADPTGLRTPFPFFLAGLSVGVEVWP